MDNRFIVERQGKQFVLYAGLLDAAHEKGIASLETTLLQTPSPSNEYTAMVSARVTLKDGRTFGALGDCNPTNSGPVARLALIRMAETRAKARALRDALNITAELLDEGDGTQEEHAKKSNTRAEKSQQDNGEYPATARTMRAVWTAAKLMNKSQQQAEADLKKVFGNNWAETITEKQARQARNTYNRQAQKAHEQRAARL